MATGRPCIFGPKDHPQTVRALGLTTRGRECFERARANLKRLAKWSRTVSDADVIEALARGKAETVKYLKEKK